MAFTPKVWHNYPLTDTPVSAAALIDIETRLAAYADTVGAAITTVGGDLTGTLPNPSIGTAKITSVHIAGSLKPSVSAAAGTEALRALGVTSSTAAAGNDSRLTDQRVPTDGSVTAVKVASSLKPSGTATPATEALRALGTTANTAAAGNDIRVTSESVNPMDKQFAGGAVGDGTTDDGAALVACLAATDGVSRSHMVIPDKTFLTSQQLASDAATGLSITGFGKSSKLVAAPGLNKAVLRINTSGDSNTPPRIAKVTLDNFAVDHQGTLQADGTEGIKGAVVIYAPDDADIDRLYISNARNTGLDCRGGRRVRLDSITVDTVINSLGANGFNLGGLTGVGQTASSDYSASKLTVIGSNQMVNDAIVTGGDLTHVSSATANFAVGMCLIVDGAGSSGGRHLCVITAQSSGVATVVPTAVTPVSGARAMLGYVDVAVWWGSVNADKFTLDQAHVIGGCNSGVLSEGGSGNSKHANMAQCEVENARNQGFGWATLGGGTVLPHDKGTIDNCTAINPFIGAVAAGNDYLISNLRIDGFLGDGLVLGGQDYDEVGTIVSDANIRAGASASGYCINIAKSGTYTNFLRSLKLRGCHLDGNGVALNCVRVAGKVKNIGLDGCTIQNAKNAGVLYVADNSVAPKDSRILGGDIRNNNKGGNSAGVSSVGVGVSAGDGFIFQGIRVTDDQATPTQTHGFHWTTGAVNALFVGNDLRGNKTGAINNAGAFDGNTEARVNKGWTIPVLGSGATVTLVPGEVIKISGSADITSITASNEGRAVTLIFTGTASANGLVSGSNLKINGNFVYKPNSSISLVCDGTNWYEVGWSQN